MGQSKTMFHGEDFPTWARYSVQICHRAGRDDAPRWDREPEQVFSSRYAAERFARDVSLYFPRRTGDELTIWALVNALPTSESTRRCVGERHCYLSIDPGNVTIKDHGADIGVGFYGACRQSREAA